MEDPFFGVLWDRFPESPPRNHDSDAFFNHRKPKNVVSVPVNFVNSADPKSTYSAVKIPMDEATAAVKIQAAFRGFSMRKPATLKKLRVIMKTKAEAAEIWRRISDCHLVEIIRRDEKERVKMSESIMSLLLRLDAIQGVNYFVRELRKAVTRKVVDLQEMVDDIIAGKSMQEMDMEALVSSEVAEDECSNADENASVQCLYGSSNEEIEDKELLSQVKQVVVEAEQNEMQEEEFLYSQMEYMQMEGCENGKENNSGLENFEQGFLVVRQTVSGPEECTTVDGTGGDAGDSKENKFGRVPDTAHSIPCTEEDVMTGNSRDDKRSYESLDLLKTETIEADGWLDADDNGDYEEVMGANDGGDKFPKREAVDDIAMVREENERLKRTVADLLKKSEKQTEMINNMSLTIACLEEQVCLCRKTNKIGEGGKKTAEGYSNFSGMLSWEENQNAPTLTLTEERTAQPNDMTSRKKSDGHLHGFVEDWF